MQHRGVRFGLVVLAAAAVVAAAYQTVGLEWQRDALQQASDAFEREAWRALLAAADLSGAVRGYVAEGQGEPFWLSRAGEQRAALARNLTALRARARHPDAARALDAATSALEAFGRADQRARDYMATGQRLMASDVIFSDGLETLATVARRIDEARAADTHARAEELAALRRAQSAWALGASAIGLLAALVLAPGGRPRRATPQRAATPTTSEPAATPRPPTVTPNELKTAAELCTDLARVAETADLPPLLERAARLLDASGVVIWMLDAASGLLRPLAAHGYTATAVDRMGTVSRDADNAVAIAFRSRKVQIVPSTERADGAIVVPLLTPTGCAGVFSAEVRRGTEGSDSLCALAAILAAQVAALVGAAPPAEEQPAAGRATSA